MVINRMDLRIMDQMKVGNHVHWPFPTESLYRRK